MIQMNFNIQDESENKPSFQFSVATNRNIVKISPGSLSNSTSNLIPFLSIPPKTTPHLIVEIKDFKT